MKSSIRKRLVGNFMLVIIITVVILEVLLFNGVRHYYYKGTEEILFNQLLSTADIYSRYFSTTDLGNIIIDDMDVFLHHTNAQVQILDLDGKVLMDSIGASHPSNRIETSDILEAMDGRKGTWIGNVGYDTSSVMAVSYPLTLEDKVVGILRFVTSLKKTNSIINNIGKVLLAFGLVVISISGGVGLLLANTIVRPLEDVTEVADKMARGQLKIRSRKRFNDEIGKLSDTLNYMAEELIRKEQLKNDFISSVSHELRTPLTSIKGWAITLQGEELNENPLLLDGLEIIEQESDRLGDMVDELLDFSKFVSGRIVLDRDEIDMREIVNRISRQVQPKADEANITLEVLQDADMPNVFADANRVKQVLINLLDNALKFTPNGGEVLIKTLYEKDYVIIEVEDNGYGIAEEDLPHIKERFYKGKDSRSNSGLGLSICDEIMNLHGGSMRIESEPNRGTRVIVSFPLEVVQDG
ncbi:MAG: HAMP domain-containing histidine kinase [Tissierellia bacterium]|nr:HAMP domain-containing histidine kinase [Tissierellia bacterium]